MSDQVTIKLDSRIFYALIAIVAVIGIFAIGWWLGTQLNQPQEASVPTAAEQQAVDGQAQPDVNVIPAGQDPSQAIEQPVQQPPPIQTKGSKPVPVSQIAVEEGQPRLAMPEIESTNYTWDFGKIAADEVTEKDFVVMNAGLAELVIEEASATCGCTAALVADSNISPDEQTTVRVSYDPRVNREAGRFIQKQVRIKSNDPLVPLAEFTISADVAPQ